MLASWLESTGLAVNNSHDDPIKASDYLTTPWGNGGQPHHGLITAQIFRYEDASSDQYIGKFRSRLRTLRFLNLI